MRIFTFSLVLINAYRRISAIGGMAYLDSTPTDQERLHAKLLHNYDNTRVPIDRADLKAVNVSIYMWPYDILYVKEAQSAIKFCGWIDMYWHDPQLVWDPQAYGDMNETFIVRSLLWLPEVDIYYRKDEPSPQGCPHCPVHVDYDGRVLRGFYFAYSFPCKIDVTLFPFDEHKCSMQIANWHMDDRYMDLYPMNATVDLSIFLPNEEWLLISCNVTRDRMFYSYGHFPILTYTLHIKRKPFFYICNLVLPSFTLTLTALVGFHMSSMGSGTHQEKVKMGLTTILAIFFLQAGVSDKLPRTSDSVPLIAKFYANMVGLLSSAIITSSLVIAIEKQGIYKRPVPLWLRKLFRVNTLIIPDGSCHEKKHSPKNSTKPNKSPCKENGVINTDDENAGSPVKPGKKCRMLDCSCHFEDYTANCQSLESPLLTVVSRRVAHENGGISPSNHNNCANNYLPNTQLTNSTTTSTNQNNQQMTKMELTQFLKFMAKVKDQIDKINGRQQRDDRFAQIKVDWLLLADRVENVSLCVFVFLAALSLWWFMYAGGAFKQ